MNDLKGKRLLILGGVSAMIEVAERAHEFGITVLVTDYLEDSPAKKYADEAYMVSATDVDAVVELCKEKEVDGIITGNVDMLLPYYAEICDKCGLPCYGTKEHMEIMTDKKRFKDICVEYGVPVVREYSKEQIEKKEIEKFPVIVKPIDSSGSRGISVCNDYEELDKGIEKALSFSSSNEYLVEEYMTGPEVVLYYYFQDGTPVFAGMCDRFVNREQVGMAQLPVAYIFPSKYLNEHLGNTDKKYVEMFRGIGMQNGSIFLQAFMDGDTVRVYEPGYRLNGAREQYIVSAVTGVSTIDMLISFALTGEMATYDIKTRIDPFLHGKYGCKLSPLVKEGTVDNIVNRDNIMSHAGVVKVVPNINVGDVVAGKKIGTLQQIAYRAFIVNDSLPELKETIDFIQNEVDYLDPSGKSLLMKQFDTNILLNDY